MPPEIRFTPFGVPYLVEFSNVVFFSNQSRSQKLPRSVSLPVLRQPPSASLSRSATTKSTFSKIIDLFVLSKSRKVRNCGTPNSSRLFRSGTSKSAPLVSEKVHHRAACSPLPIALKSFPTPHTSTISLPSSSGHSNTTVCSKWSTPPSLPPPVVTPSMMPCSAQYADGLYIRSERRSIRPRSARSVAQLRRTIADALEKAGMEAPQPSEGMSSEDFTHDSEKENSRRLAAQLSRGDYGDFKAALKTVGLTYEKCIQTKTLPDGRSCVAMLHGQTLNKDRGGKTDEAALKFCPATRLGAMFVTKSMDNGRVELRKFTVWA